MRACPKCGHVDPICWRSGAFHPEFQYADFDSLELLETELFSAVKDKKPGEIIQIGDYVFWKSTRSNTVRRIWIEDYKLVGKKGSPQERVSHNPQTTLDGGQLKTNSPHERWVMSESATLDDSIVDTVSHNMTKDDS